MKNYDLTVLGTGGAGYKSAMDAKNAGWEVAVVNDGPFGGTCSVRGCIPKKVLSGAAEVMDLNRRLEKLGIITETPKTNWSKLIEHKSGFTDPVPKSTKDSLEKAGIDVFEDQPRFTGNLKLEVGKNEFETKKVLIAVGAKPAKLPIKGFDLLTTSDEFLSMEELPNRVVFVGGGYVSFELAHVANSFGAKTTILHNDERPLPIFDKDIIGVLANATESAGINLRLEAEVHSIEKSGMEIVVNTSSGESITCDMAVHGAGRPPAIADLNLEAANIEYDPRKGVLVDDYLRSVSNKDVYAAGDVAASGPPLSPVASRQGKIVADNILGGESKVPDYTSTPSVIFTTPTVGMVGLNENQAKEKDLKYDVIAQDTSKWFDNSRLDQNFAMSKVLVEEKTGKILGAHLIGSHASEIINLFSLAIELGLTTKQLKQPIFAFPTSSDDVRSMF